MRFSQNDETRLCLSHLPHPELKFDDPAVILGAGSFGVVLHAELRGSAVALKSLRTGGKNGFNSNGTYTGTQGSLNATAKKSNYGRSAKNGMFSFIDSGYATVEDEERRGLLRLQRAFQQASRTVLEKEANRKKERENALVAQ